jgi:hypothetical protein
VAQHRASRSAAILSVGSKDLWVPKSQVNCCARTVAGNSEVVGCKSRLSPLGQSLLAAGAGYCHLVRSCWHQLQANAARPEIAGTMRRLLPLGRKLSAPAAG